MWGLFRTLGDGHTPPTPFHVQRGSGAVCGSVGGCSGPPSDRKPSTGVSFGMARTTADLLGWQTSCRPAPTEIRGSKLASRSSPTWGVPTACVSGGFGTPCRQSSVWHTWSPAACLLPPRSPLLAAFARLNSPGPGAVVTRPAIWLRVGPTTYRSPTLSTGDHRHFRVQLRVRGLPLPDCSRALYAAGPAPAVALRASRVHDRHLTAGTPTVRGRCIQQYSRVRGSEDRFV